MLDELQSYLDKYQKRVKFILLCTCVTAGGMLTLIIDEA